MSLTAGYPKQRMFFTRASVYYILIILYGEAG